MIPPCAAPSKYARIHALMFLGLLALWLTGCSIKKVAIDQLGDALASSGSTFASDNDPELVREAVPFSLKLMESLLAETPDHEGLLVAAASGFTQYGYAFVQMDADRIEDQDFARAESLRDRARNLYLRARDYGLRALEAAYPGFRGQLRLEPAEAAARLEREDLPAVYWTAAAWGAAISVSKNDPDLIADQIYVEALIDRALQLDGDFDRGAIHTFLISYEMARQGGAGDPAERAEAHFAKAVALSEEQLAAPYVAFAESVLVPQQDHERFKALLGKALEIDPDTLPEYRLANLIMQDRARWLLSRMDEMFLIPPGD